MNRYNKHEDKFRMHCIKYQPDTKSIRGKRKVFHEEGASTNRHIKSSIEVAVTQIPTPSPLPSGR